MPHISPQDGLVPAIYMSSMEKRGYDSLANAQCHTYVFNGLECYSIVF